MSLHALIVVLLLLAQAPSPPGVRPPTIPAGTSTISGRVTDAATGLPLAGVRVRLTAVFRRSGSDTESRTDQAGRYEFAGIASGRYALQVEHRGYVGQIFGSPHPPPPGGNVSPIVLIEGAKLAAMDLALTRGGSIRGRVIDQTGQPLREARVLAIDKTRDVLASHVSVVASSTDANGDYLIEGVPEGRFIVQAMARPDPANAGAGSPDTLATYHPSTTEQSEAVSIVMTGTGEIRDINVVVQRKTR